MSLPTEGHAHALGIPSDTVYPSDLCIANLCNEMAPVINTVFTTPVPLQKDSNPTTNTSGPSVEEEPFFSSMSTVDYSDCPVMPWSNVFWDANPNDEGDADTPVLTTDHCPPSVFNSSTKPRADGNQKGVRKKTLSQERINSFQWEQKRPRIKELYAQEGTLKKVMSVLASEDNFHPSERRLRQKLVEWRMKKNLTKNQAQYMLAIQLKRKKDEGKETEFRLNGEVVPAKKLDRHKKILLAEPNALLESNLSHSSISAYSPNNSFYIKRAERFSGGEETSKKVEPCTASLTAACDPSSSLVQETSLIAELLERSRDITDRLCAGESLRHEDLDIEITGGVCSLTGIVPRCSTAREDHMACPACEGISLKFHQNLDLASIQDTAVKAVLVLPLIYRTVNCLLSRGRYPKCETSTDKAFMICNHLDRTQRFRSRYPFVILQGKIYLGQGKVYALEQLMIANLAKARSIEIADEAILVLKKMLVIATLCTISPDRLDFGGFKMSLNQERFMIHVLTESNDAEKSVFNFGALEFLRARYEADGRLENLLWVTERLEPTLADFLHHQHPHFPLAVLVARGVVSAYARIGQFHKGDIWRSRLSSEAELFWELNMFKMNLTSDPGLLVTSIIRGELLSNQLPSKYHSDYPLRYAFDSFLAEEEPFVQGPWKTTS